MEKKKAFDLINRPEKKFVISIMIANGISSQGLNKLILLDASENDLLMDKFPFF